jgi:hypothetical protein
MGVGLALSTPEDSLHIVCKQPNFCLRFPSGLSIMYYSVYIRVLPVFQYPPILTDMYN